MDCKRHTRYFINLTNGLEAFEHYSFRDPEFIRIQSTYLERGLLNLVLADLDYNFLMCLATGMRCIIYDYTSRYGKERGSRAMWQGVEWIKYALNRCWFNKEIECEKGMHNHFRKVYNNEVTKRTKNKLKYFRKFLMCKNLTIEIICWKTIHDNDYEYYRKIVKENL